MKTILQDFKYECEAGTDTMKGHTTSEIVIIQEFRGRKHLRGGTLQKEWIFTEVHSREKRRDQKLRNKHAHGNI